MDALHVMPRENDWYQNSDTGPAVTRIAEVLSARTGRICTYGASMGGYAALRFARRIGAQTAIALAPQFTIHPNVASFDRRWKESQMLSFRPELNGDFALPEQSVLIYDPSVKEDARHVELIARQGDVELAPILYAGHSVGLMLSQVNLLGEFVIDLLEGRADTRQLVLTARQRRRESAQYWATLGLKARRRRLALACGMAARATEMAPNYEEYQAQRDEYERLRRAREAPPPEPPPPRRRFLNGRPLSLPRRALRYLLR